MKTLTQGSLAKSYKAKTKQTPEYNAKLLFGNVVVVVVVPDHKPQVWLEPKQPTLWDTSRHSDLMSIKVLAVGADFAKCKNSIT